MSPQNHSVPLPQSQMHVIDPANPRRALGDGIEHRLHVSGGAADDAEHLGGCRLMLQGLAQFGIALAELFEQAHVLDGDYGLRGKGLQQPHLLIGKRLHLGAADHDYPNRNTFTD